MTKLLQTLRVSATARILVADLPAAYGAAAARYNAAIDAVVRATHSELIDLASTAITLAKVNGLPPQPDTPSQQMIRDRIRTRHR